MIYNIVTSLPQLIYLLPLFLNVYLQSLPNLRISHHFISSLGHSNLNDSFRICFVTSSSVTVLSTASNIICCCDTVSNSTSSLKERVMFEPLSTSCLILNTVVVVKFSTLVFLNFTDI